MKIAAVVALVAAVTVLAACGSDSGGGGGGQAGKPATLKVGVIPIADVAPLYLAARRASSRRRSSRSTRNWPRAALPSRRPW